MSILIFESLCQKVESECYFSKVRLLDRWVASIFDNAFERTELTPHQFNLLIAIHSMGSFASAKMLSQYLKMEKSTVSRDLKILAAKRFLRERIDDEDSRKKILEITKDGIKAIVRCRKVWDLAQKEARKIFEKYEIRLIDARQVIPK